MSKKNTAATIATIIVAVLAIATTLFLLYQTSQQQIQENQYNYVPSDEVNEEMNMNAVRSHYPPDEHFLDMCDSLGIVYMD